MATRTWNGDVNTEFANAANWSSNTAPVSGDTIVFDSSADANAVLVDLRPSSGQFAEVVIENNFDQLLSFEHTSAQIKTNKLTIKAKGKIQNTTGGKITFVGGGTSGVFVFFNHADMASGTLGMFNTTVSRTRTIFDFSEVTAGTAIKLENGVYPNIYLTGTGNNSTFSPTAVTAAGTNTYPTTDILQFQTDSDTSVIPATKNQADLGKIFRIHGNLYAQCADFNWGNTTLEIQPQDTNGSKVPYNGAYSASGNFRFGTTGKIFKAKYNHLRIAANSGKYFEMDAGAILSANKLTILPDARFYGPDTTVNKGAEIQCVELPTILGDWNFAQIAEGIYRSRSNPPPYQEYHSILANNLGSNGQVLAIASDGSLEWSSSAGGGSDITVQDEGSTVGAVATTLNFAGNGVVASGSGATKTITITDTDTNTNQLTTFTLRGTTNTSPTTVNHGDTITIAAGTGITTTSTSDGTITIANTVTDTNTNQLTEFTLAGDSGSSQTIAHGNTLTIAGGTNITSVASATDTITLNVDDAFLKNDANDSTTGTITAAGFATTNGPVNFVRSHASAVTMVVEQDGTGDIASFKGASDELLTIRRAGSLKFNLSTSGGAADEAIMTYRDTGGDERNFMSIDAGTVVLHNRGPDGDVEIRGNSGSAGSGGETTIAKFEDTLVTLSKDTTLEKTGSPTFSIKTSSSNSAQANLTLHGARNADGNPIGQIAFTNNDDSGTNTGTYTAAKIFAFNDGGDKAGGLQFQTVPAGSSTALATALTIQEDTNIVTANNLTVGGNLIVSGDSITVNAETITTEEAMLSLGIGQTATDTDALDFGFYGTYDVSDTQKYRGLFADASDSGKFKLFKDVEAEPTTTVDTTATGYAVGTLVANLEGNVTGNVTGNVSGTAASVTGASQSNITSVGTLTSLTMTSPLTINHAGSDVFADIIGPLNRNLRFVLRDNGDTDAFIFRNAAGTDIMKLLRTGTLLVGKSAPIASVTRNLEVEGSIAAASDGTGGVGFHMKNSEGEFILYTDDGNLLIKDYAGSDTYPFKIMGTAETDTLKILTGGDVRVKDRLGVGTDTPSTKLEVVGDITAERLNLDKTSGYSSIEVKGGDGAFIDLGNKDGTNDDFDARLITDGTGLDIVTSGANHITLKTNGSQRFKVEDATITMYPSTLQFASGSAPTIKGGNHNPLTIYGNADGTAQSTTNNIVSRSTAAAIDFDVNASQQLAMRIKDNKDVDVYGVLSGPGIAEGAFGANSFHLGDTGSTEAQDWYEVFRWTPNVTMSAANSNQYRNFAAKFNVIGRGLQRINYDIYVRGEYGVQDSTGWWSKEFIIDGLDISQADANADGSADTDSPDADSIFKMVYNAGTSLSMPFASLYVKRDENWEIRTCNLISMFTNCVFEFKDTNIGETDPTNDTHTGSSDLSPSIRKKLRVDTNNQLINGVAATGIYFDDTNDRLGVGTSSPSTEIHLSGASHPSIRVTGTDNAGADPAIELLGTADNFTEGGQLWYDNGTGVLHLASLYNNDAADIQFHTKTAADRSTSNVRMTIAGDGKVGIGDTNPIAAKLHVEVSADTTTYGPTCETFRYAMLLRNNTDTTNAFTGIAFDVSSETDFDSMGASIAAVRDTSAGSTAANHDANLVFATNDAGDAGLTERMRITHDGFVGIGTTTPVSPLHVSGGDLNIYNGTSESHLVLRRDATGQNYGSSVRFEFGDSVSASSGHLYARIVGAIQDSTNDSEDGYLRFDTSGGAGVITERMRITHEGNVGIGTTSPDAPLHIEHSSGLIAKMGEGNVETRMQFADARAMIGYVSDALTLQGGSGSKYIRFGVNNGTFGSGEVARFDVDGHLLIGTTSYSGTASHAALEVSHSTQANLRVTDSSATASSDFAQAENDLYIINRKSSGDIKIRVNSSDELMTFDGGNQRVGIGTTSPAHLLDVDGDGRFGTTGVAGKIYLSADAANSFISWNANGTDVTLAADDDLILHADDTLALQAGGTTVMTLLSGGNVGVGTTSPSHKLEVNGSFAATTKSFDIEHPTEKGKRLHHGSLEGPEHGVYIRGKNNSGTIHLPDYWKGLVDEDSITVQLTAIGKPQDLYVREIKNGRIRVAAKSRGTHLNYFYFIQAERKDVEKMVVEY